MGYRLGLFLMSGWLWLFTAAAQQIPNSDFEEWTYHEGRFLNRSYHQPAYWTTGNSALETIPGIEPPTRKSADAHSGNAAVLLVTTKVMGQIAPGNIFLGTFKLNITRPVSGIKLGKPFVDKPGSFSIWYKYHPEAGDSCILSVYLCRHNKLTKKREVLGGGKFVSATKQDEYVKATINITYDSIYTPDSIIAVFCSSAGYEGERSVGSEGSMLWLDDFELHYEPLAIFNNAKPELEPYPNPASEYVLIPKEIHNGSRVMITALNGQRFTLSLTHANNTWNIDVSSIPSGYYQLLLETPRQRKVRRLCIVR
jgi:hypothetical protein